MAERGTIGPDGVRWHVRRRWVPRFGPERWWERVADRVIARRRRRRERGGKLDALDLADGCAVDGLQDLALAVALVVLVLVLALVVWPLLLALVDVLVLIVLAIAGGLTRVLLRRPWTVEAAADDGRALRWRVVGWRASGRVRDAVAAALARGEVPAGAVDARADAPAD